MTEVVDNPDRTDLDGDIAPPVAERLFGLLSDAIIRGELEPGTAMTEPDLARRFGVSRAPLREALRRLEEQQLLERSPYRGMRVAELSEHKVGDLYEIREELEGLACRRAAERMNDDALTRLRQALAEERRYISGRASGRLPYTAAPRALGLHAVTARVAGNRELEKILDSSIWRLLRADYWRRVKRAEALRASHVEHAAIVRALGQRDGAMAELLMRRHIRNTMLRRQPQ